MKKAKDFIEILYSFYLSFVITVHHYRYYRPLNYKSLESVILPNCSRYVLNYALNFVIFCPTVVTSALFSVCIILPRFAYCSIVYGGYKIYPSLSLHRTVYIYILFRVSARKYSKNDDHQSTLQIRDFFIHLSITRRFCGGRVRS